MGLQYMEILICVLQVSYEDGEEESLWLAAERVRLLTYPSEVFCLPPTGQHLKKLAQKLLDGSKGESGMSAASQCKSSLGHSTFASAGPVAM